MRTDTTLHRVYPVTSGRRVIVNMGYAARGDLTKQISHETMDNLWPAGPRISRHMRQVSSAQPSPLRSVRQGDAFRTPQGSCGLI